jgi:mRNA-degrading endonuclease RelE of RelBE toxin-antitoxin system
MSKSIKITYLKKAKKFLDKNQNILKEDDVDDMVIKTIKKKIYNIDENIDIKDLKGILKNKIRIRKGKIRIIIEIVESEIIIESIIEDIDFRGNIYK